MEQSQGSAIPKILTTLPGYILVETATIEWFNGVCGGFSLVDQKAAHSRIIFETLLGSSAKPLEVQELLIPYQISLSSIDAKKLITACETLHKKGF